MATQNPVQLAALLQTLGIQLTPEQLEERVIAQVVASILGQDVAEIDLSEDEYDEDGEVYPATHYRNVNDQLKQRALVAVRKRLDASIDKYLEEHMATKFDSLVRSIVFPNTNKYGEPKGSTITFLEFFEKKAGEYMSELVDSEGKPYRDSYNRNGGTPRLAWMIGKAIRADLDVAIKNALVTIGESIGEQIKQVVTSAANAVKVTVR